MDAFESREWHTAERVIVEIKDLLSKQVRLNPPDAVALNPFIEQADADLAEARRNRRSAPAPVAPPARASPSRVSLPASERKAAKHDWGATARAREKPFGSDDDDDDFCVVDPASRIEAPKNLGGPRRAVNRRAGRGGDTRAGERRERRELAENSRFASAPRGVRQRGPQAGCRKCEERRRADDARAARLERRRRGRERRRDRAERVRASVRAQGVRGSRSRRRPRRGTDGEETRIELRHSRPRRRTVFGRASFLRATMRRLSPNGEPIPETLLKMDRDIVDRVVAEILETPTTIKWETIAGLEHAKAAVQELAVWPLMKPELFRGARAVPRGLLLFGPPGTGKTLIGRAVASQCGATFFSISASSLTSKWIGEGEKMVRALFAVAAARAGGDLRGRNRFASVGAQVRRRARELAADGAEFLVQMDGLGGDEGRMLLIGATNRPQELDDGARRRLAKQLYIPLPCAAARRAMVTNILRADASVAHALSDSDLDTICLKTEGYSGSDMKHLTQEAARAPLRELFSRAAHAEVSAAGIPPLPSPSAMRPIKLVDFKRASKQVRPSVTQADIEFHEKWNREHGAMSGGADGEEEEEDEDEW